MSLSMWITYFTLNSGWRDIPWELGPDLPFGEAAWVIPSLREFQRGESSDGARLRRAASVWAGRHHHEPGPLLHALDLFIAEEQRHAAELARYLALNGHATLPRCGSDTVFRLLRRVTGSFEVSLSVLLTAEIIGYTYYASLRSATGSPMLRRLCETFLRDEAAHLVFHADQLGRMRSARRQAALGLTRALSHAFLAATCVFVWSRHRAVLRRGGHSLRSFASTCRARLALAAPRARRSMAGSLEAIR